jgi:hypothetical protein
MQQALLLLPVIDVKHQDKSVIQLAASRTIFAHANK